MNVLYSVLETRYQEFVFFLKKEKNEDFKSFASSPFLKRDEHYKKEIYEIAKAAKQQDSWKESDIGTGKILHCIKQAVKQQKLTEHHHNDNLLEWYERKEFIGRDFDQKFEELLFRFYKNKTSDQVAFDRFIEEGLKYKMIAFLFFIKDKDQYLPIAQERFDRIFQLLDIPEFKTSRNTSWNNYKEYIDIVKQVRTFLKKEKNHIDVTLLDAHSFLFVIGNQMQNAQFANDLDLKLKNSSEQKEDTGIEYNEITLTSELQKQNETVADETLPEEFKAELINEIYEGAKKTIIVNSYERSRDAREMCIQHWKAVCAVCGFDFEKRYGSVGKGFIHVHHITPIHQIGQSYEVDPVNDLRPVCPNCHAMLHRGKDRSIEELRLIIEEKFLYGEDA